MLGFGNGHRVTCAECHNEPTGAFHLGASRVWEGHVHSAAFETLKRDYTKEIARRARGIDDPLNDWRCVKCHVSAYGADESQIAPSYSNEDGVTCEVCHGPSSEYADRDHGAGVPNREDMVQQTRERTPAGRLTTPEDVADVTLFLTSDLARMMHADEALMALIVVAFWHLSNVHLVPGRSRCC